MNELIKIEYQNDNPTVLARDLHEALEVKTSYKDWFPRMCEYGFAAGKDFNPLKNERVIRKSNTVQKSTLSALGISRFTTPIAPDLSTLTTSVLKVRL